MDFVLLALFVLGVAGLGAVLLLFSWLRERELGRRIERLETEVRGLRSAPRPVDLPAPALAASAAACAPPLMPAEVPARAAPIAPGSSAASMVPPPPPPKIEMPGRPPPLPPIAAPREFVGAGSSGNPSTPIAAAPPAPAAGFDLERWLGVRGAAVLGGVFLIVAGFLFLQYSIDRGWVTPPVRLITGAISGAICLVVAHFLRKREYQVLSNSLCGAGVVLLYAVAWAAHQLYGLIGFPSAFAAMVATTALCAALSYRYASQLIAVLGLLGGFATPLVLSTGADHPIGLFGYALLLDLGFLFVAHRRRWPTIGMVALGGTFLVQGLWIARRMDPGELAIGVVALGSFGLLFSVFSALQPAAQRSRWIPSQVGALLLPFCFAIYFAQRIDFGFHLAPLAMLAGVMMLAGGVLARLQKTPWLSIGTVSGALSLVLIWTFSNARELSDARALELVICALALAAIELGFAEWEHRKTPAQRDAASAAAFACLGLLIACAYACGQGVVPLSCWLAALVMLPLALLRLHSFGTHFAFALLGSFASGAGIAAWAGHGWRSDAALNRPGLLGLSFIVVPIGFALLAAARWLRAEIRPSAFFAVSVFFPMAMLAVCLRTPAFALPTELRVTSGALAAAILALGLAMSLAANGARSSRL
ncbi:MAG: DUF2339 domain-containing protein, partial [Planctomycetota bacterium]